MGNDCSCGSGQPPNADGSTIGERVLKATGISPPLGDAKEELAGFQFDPSFKIEDYGVVTKINIVMLQEIKRDEASTAKKGDIRTMIMVTIKDVKTGLDKSYSIETNDVTKTDEKKTTLIDLITKVL